MTEKQIYVFKYGGNAMVNEELKRAVLSGILNIKSQGKHVVLVHGGGPFIKQALNEAGIESEFIAGQRVTTPKAFEYVEMALNGKVNGDLVSTINSLGHKAVGLSGKDGKITRAEKRLQKMIVDGEEQIVDLQQVGNLAEVNPELLHLLLQKDYIPVISCISADENGVGYNINGDTFAGAIAGALQADMYGVLTDVDGLLTDMDKPETIIRQTDIHELKEFIKTGIIQGGMIPKIEACMHAINSGAKSAKIINGTKPEQINDLDNKQVGTLIKLKQ